MKAAAMATNADILVMMLQRDASRLERQYGHGQSVAAGQGSTWINQYTL